MRFIFEGSITAFFFQMPAHEIRHRILTLITGSRPLKAHLQLCVRGLRLRYDRLCTGGEENIERDTGFALV